MLSVRPHYIRARTVFRALVLALISCVVVCAQSNFATVTGRVEDPSRSPVSSALVTVRARATGAARARAPGAVRATTSNSEGIYELPNLMPGEYSVEVNHPGFSPLTRQITLEVG